MDLPLEADEQAVAIAFLQLFRSDREGPDGPRNLAHYQSRFPGHESVIAREYLRINEVAPPREEASSERARGQDAVAGTVGSTRYQPLTEVGRGGMGVVVRVRDERLRRDVAMKVLVDGGPGPAPGTGPSRLHRFLDEAWITGQLGHPGIVPVHDMGMDDAGQPYFTMTLIEGRSLAEIFDRHQQGDPEWSTPRILGTMLRVCEAVAFAHSRNVIHRDLKPANVMVGSFGETYVLDWGLARIREPDAKGQDSTTPNRTVGPAHPSATRTMAGDVVGTPAYMAPEQARGESDLIDAQVDVYSVGAMLYHLISGHMPYGDSAHQRLSSQEVLALVRECPPASIQQLRRQAPPELLAICEKAMQRDRGARYATMTALAEDLRAFLEVRVVKAYRTGPFVELRKWVQRNRALASVVMLAMALISVGLGYSLQQKSKADHQASMAEQNFRLARDSVDRMLTHVGQHRLANEPRMEELRRELLREALLMHEELLEQRQGDKGTTEAVAWSALRVARIRSQLGEYEEAVAAAHRAIAAFASLVASPPVSRDGMLGLLEAHYSLGVTLVNQGRHQEAEASYRAAIEKVDDLLRDHPMDPVLLERKAGLLTNLGTSLTRHAGWKAALPVLRESVTFAELWHNLQRDDGNSAKVLAHTSTNLGIALANVGELKEAEEWLTAAVHHCRPVSKEHEREGTRRHALATAWNRLAMVQFQLKNVSGSQSSLESGIALLSGLVEEFPHTISHRRELAASLNNLGNVLHATGDTTGQERALVEAERQHSLTLASAPDDAMAATMADQTRRTLCRFLIQAGRHGDATRRIQEFADAEHAPMKTVEAARFLMRCAALAAQDEQLDQASRTQVAERYTSMAVQRLAAAADIDADVLSAEEFDPLRERKDFKELLDRLRGG